MCAEPDPDAFADRFGRCMAGACEGTGPGHVAVDGKSARRAAAGTFTGCPRPAEAWAVGNRLTLGQRSVPSAGHEITTAPDLLAAPDLTGAVVTVDGALCPKQLVPQMRAQGGHDVACVKGNQKGLHGAGAGVFARAGAGALAGCDMAAEVADGHGRSEERHVTTVTDPGGLPDGWADVGAVALVCRGRAVGGRPNGGTARYDLTSLRVGGAEPGGYVRNHWGIETGPDWVPDIAFREGDGRARAGHAGANLGMIRRAALSLLERADTKGRIRTRRMKAAWGDTYLLKVLEILTTKRSAPALP